MKKQKYVISYYVIIIVSTIGSSVPFVSHKEDRTSKEKWPNPSETGAFHAKSLTKRLVLKSQSCQVMPQQMMLKIRLLQVDTHCDKTRDPTRPDLLSSYVDIYNHLDMHARIYRHLFV